jgi:hypothetical protein
MKRIILTAALILAAFAAGCVTPPAGIDAPSAITKSKRESLKTGLTRDQLQSILGAPESRLTTADGEVLFFKDVNLASVWALFGKDGKLRDWKWSE